MPNKASSLKLYENAQFGLQSPDEDAVNGKIVFTSSCFTPIICIFLTCTMRAIPTNNTNHSERLTER